MASIGWATLSVIPEVQKVPSGIAKRIGAPLRAAGTQAGRDAGDAIAGGIAAAQMKVDKATEALAKSQDKVADAAGRTRVAQAQLNALTDKGVTDSARLTAANEKLEAARRKELAATRDATKAADNLADAERRAATATDDVADTAERAGGGFKSMFSGVGDGTKKLAGLAAGLAGVSVAADGMGKAMEQGQIGSKLAASFGETAEEAKRYGQVAGDLYASGVGSSIDDISEAVSAVGGSFGSLDSMGAGRLEELSAKASGFATIFDQDIAGSVQSASLLMTNGLAANADEAFDLMTRGMQEVSVEMRSELPEILNEYGTNFRALGFDGAESFNILIAASQNGGIALDKTGDALKEFTIRATDGSKATAEAYAAIGGDADLMANDVVVGGEQAQYALQETARKLLEMEDPAARAQNAIALFGSPLEDLSVDQIPAFLEGIAGADDVMGDFNGALDGSIDVLNDNAGSSLETFKRGLEQNITNMIGDNVLPMLGDFTGALEENEGSAIAAVVGMTGLGGAMAGFETAKGTFDSVKEGVLGVKDGLLEAKDTAASALDGLKTGASAVKDGFGTAKAAAGTAASSAKAAATSVAAGTAALAANTGAWVANGIATARAGVAYVAQKVALVASTVATAAATGAQWLLNVALSANPIGLIIAAVAALVAGLVWFFTQTEIGQKIVTAAWDAILSGWNWMYDKVSSGIQLLGDGLGYIGEKAGEAKDWVVEKFDSLVAFVTGLPGRIASAASGMWDGIQSAFKGAINYIIQAWNALEFRIPGFEVGPIKWDGFTLGLPDIPMLAGGGVAGRRSNGELYGPGSGTSDSILGVDAFGMPTALVSNHEGVVKETAMNAGGDRIVAALNAGWVPTADFLHGMLQGDFRANSLGIQEDNPLVGGALDLHRMLSSLPRFADGGELGGGTINASIWDVISAKFPDAQLSSGYRPGDPGFHGVKQAIDVAGPDMQGYADYAFNELRGDLAQIIWNNGPVWYNVKDNQLGTGVATAEGAEARGIYGEGTMAGHADHVHLAAEKPLGPVVAPTSPDLASAAPADMGAWTDSTAPSAASPAGATAASPDVEKSFSARDRYKKMFTDIGGIWADASLEIFGAGEWLDLADRYTIKSSDSPVSTVGTSVPVTPMSPDSAAAADPVTALTDVPDINRTGADLYSYEIARAAKEMGLGEAAAVIGEATALVESGDPLKMWANQKLPESLNLPHDAVGNDGTSTGLFQQQDNGAWGSLEQRMNPFESAKLFYDALPSGWEGMDPGAVAQQVQRSAFGEKYGPMMGRGQELVDQANLFDTGGVWQPNTWGFNGLSKPELVLKDAHWKVAEANISKIDELVGAGGGAGNSGATINQTFHTTVADQAGFHRRANRDRSLAMMQYGGRPEIGR
ncbi:phage tail tape measure protein [Rhodococcus sp. MALMAid1271]|uniref:phage tail tape measure protein n=1 Tax=Rhodococcus sp. MALMAid1271 TaxID=3411744 RepID=UPI003B9FFACC